MNKSESIKNIAGALLVAQKSMGDATKGSKNPFFKSSYADLNSIREVAIPALNAQGITVLQPSDFGPEGSSVETVLLHVSGEWISAFTKVVNTKGDAQGEGSGISYARRYGLQSLLNIGAVDDDGEAAVGRKNEKPRINSSNSTEVGKFDPDEVQAIAVMVGIDRKQKARGSAEDPKIGGGTIAESTTQHGSNGTAIAKRSNKEAIEVAFKKLEAEKKVTKETFKVKYLSGAGLSTINDTQAAIAVIKIQTDFPGIII